MKTFVTLTLAALQIAAITAVNPCVCRRNFKPVCGSDGKTYSNECTLTCESSKGNENLTVAKTGPCKAEDTLPLCFCTYEHKPVCGSDGKTYPNGCALGCATNLDKGITLAYEGECVDAVKVAEPIPCSCGREAKPVCGSNGISYANDCLLNCATAGDPSLSVKHAGKCEPQDTGADKLLPSCTCTRNLLPVCGSDGVTYNNECLLACAGQTVAKDGPC